MEPGGPGVPGSNQKEKKEPGGKSCLGFFKESWKSHCKGVVVVNYHHNGMLRAGQRDRTGNNGWTDEK